MRASFAIVAFCLTIPALFSRGSEAPVRYVGKALPDPTRPDGGLRPAVGVQNYQVMRATRARPELSDGRGWTFNHAPMLTYSRMLRQLGVIPSGGVFAPLQPLSSDEKRLLTERALPTLRRASELSLNDFQGKTGLNRLR
jgi:hypothetical protein